MKTVGDLLVEFKEKQTPTEELPVLTLTERNGFVYQADRFNKRLATEDTSNYKVVRQNDLAFNPYLLWAGAIAQNTITEAGVISPLYPTFRVRSGNDPRYVARLLLTPQLIAAYDTIAFGSVPRRRRTSVSDFLQLPLPGIPPLADQQRITTILDQAQDIRTKRRQVLAHLDSLAQSIFQDVTRESAGTRTLAELGVNFISGRNVLGTDHDAHPRNRVIKVSAISSGLFKPHDSKPMPSDYVPPTEHLIRKGDILFGRASGSLDLLGATSLVESEVTHLYLPDKVWRAELSVDSSISYPYLLGVLRSASFKAHVRHNASGAAGVRNIAKSRVLQFDAPVVSESTQEKYSEQTATLRNQISEAQRALHKTQLLFTSLQSRAFKGEL